MTTRLSADGRLEIPEEFRMADSLEPGQRCEIERVGHGDYRVRVCPEETSNQPREGLVDLLLSCPVKGFYLPVDRTETTDDLTPLSFG